MYLHCRSRTQLDIGKAVAMVRPVVVLFTTPTCKDYDILATHVEKLIVDVSQHSKEAYAALLDKAPSEIMNFVLGRFGAVYLQHAQAGNFEETKAMPLFKVTSALVAVFRNPGVDFSFLKNHVGMLVNVLRAYTDNSLVTHSITNLLMKFSFTDMEAFRTVTRHESAVACFIDTITSDPLHGGALCSDMIRLYQATCVSNLATVLAAQHDDACSLCCSPLAAGDRVIVLPCSSKHMFHASSGECTGIEPWYLGDSGRCPMCMASFFSSSSVSQVLLATSDATTTCLCLIVLGSLTTNTVAENRTYLAQNEHVMQHICTLPHASASAKILAARIIRIVLGTSGPRTWSWTGAALQFVSDAISSPNARVVEEALSTANVLCICSVDNQRVLCESGTLARVAGLFDTFGDNHAVFSTALAVLASCMQQKGYRGDQHIPTESTTKGVLRVMNLHKNNHRVMIYALNVIALFVSNSSSARTAICGMNVVPTFLDVIHRWTEVGNRDTANDRPSIVVAVAAGIVAHLCGDNDSSKKSFVDAGGIQKIFAASKLANNKKVDVFFVMISLFSDLCSDNVANATLLRDLKFLEYIAQRMASFENDARVCARTIHDTLDRNSRVQTPFVLFYVM